MSREILIIFFFFDNLLRFQLFLVHGADLLYILFLTLRSKCWEPPQINSLPYPIQKYKKKLLDPTLKNNCLHVIIISACMNFYVKVPLSLQLHVCMSGRSCHDTLKLTGITRFVQDSIAIRTGRIEKRGRHLLATPSLPPSEQEEGTSWNFMEPDKY